jgi:hypothetical protein
LYINNDCYEYGQESILNLDSNIMNYLEWQFRNKYLITIFIR